MIQSLNFEQNHVGYIVCLKTLLKFSETTIQSLKLEQIRCSCLRHLPVSQGLHILPIHTFKIVGNFDTESEFRAKTLRVPSALANVTGVAFFAY